MKKIPVITALLFIFTVSVHSEVFFSGYAGMKGDFYSS
jgi:hypothetical protein